MIHPIDIFEIDGSAVCWIGAAPTLEQAKVQIKERAAKSADGFILLDQRSGNKLYVEGGEEPGRGER
jgi:hypothetical protein